MSLKNYTLNLECIAVLCCFLENLSSSIHFFYFLCCRIEATKDFCALQIQCIVSLNLLVKVCNSHTKFLIPCHLVLITQHALTTVKGSIVYIQVLISRVMNTTFPSKFSIIYYLVTHRGQVRVVQHDSIFWSSRGQY